MSVIKIKEQAYPFLPLIDDINALSEDDPLRRDLYRDLLSPPCLVKTLQALFDGREIGWRLLQADGKAALKPIFSDKREAIYWQCARLIEAGLLERVGQCRTCGQLFLGVTRWKKIFCSGPCARRLTATERMRKSRARKRGISTCA